MRRHSYGGLRTIDEKLPDLYFKREMGRFEIPDLADFRLDLIGEKSGMTRSNNA